VTNGDTKVIYVLDIFHIMETILGHERISNFTVEEALKLVQDTAALLEGNVTASQYKRTWNLG